MKPYSVYVRRSARNKLNRRVSTQGDDKKPFDIVLEDVGFHHETQCGTKKATMKLSTLVSRIGRHVNASRVLLHDMKSGKNKSTQEWKINLVLGNGEESIPYFIVKQSTLSGAGLGLFAARNFTIGENIGLYLGLEISATTGKKAFPGSNYVMEYGDNFVDSRHGIGHESDPRVYMGCHMINDPTFLIARDSDDWTEARKKINVRCHEDLLSLLRLTLRRERSCFCSTASNLDTIDEY